MKLSARNTLKGEVISIQPGAVNAIVIIELPDGQLVTSSISIQALKDLDLRVGQQAYAVVKASDVMIGIDDSQSKAGDPDKPGSPASDSAGMRCC